MHIHASRRYLNESFLQRELLYWQKWPVGWRQSKKKIVPFQNTIDPSNPTAAISSAKRATDTSGLLDHAYFESGGKAEVHHNALALQTSTWMHDGGPVPKWSHLDQFLQKYNKVLLDKLAIESERKGLEQENTGDFRLFLSSISTVCRSTIA